MWGIKGIQSVGSPPAMGPKGSPDTHQTRPEGRVHTAGQEVIPIDEPEEGVPLQVEGTWEHVKFSPCLAPCCSPLHPLTQFLMIIDSPAPQQHPLDHPQFVDWDSSSETAEEKRHGWRATDGVPRLQNGEKASRNSI